MFSGLPTLPFYFASSGPFEADQITEGQLRITDHTEPISDASFSPDGTALATASLDGQVKFFQVRSYTNCNIS